MRAATVEGLNGSFVGQYRDQRELTVTAASAASVLLLEEAIMAYLSVRRDTAAKVQVLLQMDPECVSGLCLQAYLELHNGRRSGREKAKEIAVQAGKILRCGSGNSREDLHVKAVTAWAEGDFTGALGRLEAILSDYPRDILAIRLAQFLTSYSGNSQALCHSVSRVFSAWSPSLPGYGFVLGCFAYGLEESGEYALAEKNGRAAVELNSSDIWAAHAVTHVMEMQARPRDGIVWVEALNCQWEQCSNFANHLHWHECLFHLSLRNVDQTLELYDRRVQVSQRPEYLDIVNAASLLWRLEQEGVDVGDRWDRVARQAAERISEHFMVFVDLHYAIALARAGRRDVLEHFVDSCSRYGTMREETQGQLMASVGLSLLKAILAYQRSDYLEAIRQLQPVKHRIDEIGGSHAQRDLFHHLIVDSAILARRSDLATTLLRKWIERRPHDRWALDRLETLDFTGLLDTQGPLLSN